MTKRGFIYLIGEPGSGKSTLVNKTLGRPLRYRPEPPVPYIEYPNGTVQLGAVNNYMFPGTDALAMNIQPKIGRWLNSLPDTVPLIVAEGDRLANGKFFDMLLLRQDLTVHLFCLKTPPYLLLERRRARGTTENAAWLKGRSTKVANLLEQYQITVIDGGSTFAKQQRILQHCIALYV